MTKNKRIPCKKYFFSVEGQTELWYLQWLQKEINEQAEKFTVKFDCKTEKDPIARVRGMTVLSETTIVHIFDVESGIASDIQRFEDVLNKMRRAEKLGKSVKYQLGYSNLSFELWMILHKADFDIQLSNCLGYLKYINSYYGEHFESLNEYKEEQNFKRLLSHLSIDNVKAALERADQIQKRNMERSYKEINYRNYKYFRENPPLSLGEIISGIFSEI